MAQTPAMKPQPVTEEKPRVSFRKRIPMPVPRYTPNITPLIDVLFVLLLFFLLIARFHSPEGVIPCSLPQTGERGEGPETATVLVKVSPGKNYPQDANSVSFEGGTQIRMEKTMETPRELHAWLAEKCRMYKTKGLGKVQAVIQPKTDLPWQFVVEAYAQAVLAGYTTVGFTATGSD
jgi:biopolymer transport protein ExbD